MPPKIPHSVKVPRLYKLAAKILEESEKQGGGVKDLLYQHQHKHPNLKGILALIAKTLQYKKTLEGILENTKILKEETGLDPFLAKVLITELLWGKKELKGESKPVKTILTYKEKLEALAVTAVKEFRKKSEKRPRYVRVNTIKLTVNDAIQGFKDEGWNFIEYEKNIGYEKFLELVKNMTSEDFLLDFHIEELLVFPPYTDLHRHEAYLQGLIMLQDKASCLPVKLLNPPPGSTVLDVCAAPGMKSTQLAALMNNSGKVYSIEFNQKRLKALEELVEHAGCSCVQIIKEDALSLSADDFSTAEYAIVDPSCSGSGIERLGSEDVTKDRLLTLCKFQAKILKHVMRTFPNLKKVIYSTCSIYSEENEQVVQDIVKASHSFKLVSLKEYFGDNWLNYGSPDFGEIGERCIYARPNVDLTIGFFVAVFERLKEGEENELLDENYIREVVIKEGMKGKRVSKKKMRQESKERKALGSEKEEVTSGKDKIDVKDVDDETAQADKTNEEGIVQNEGEEKKPKIKTRRGKRAPKKERKMRKEANSNEIEPEDKKSKKRKRSEEGDNEKEKGTRKGKRSKKNRRKGSNEQQENHSELTVQSEKNKKAKRIEEDSTAEIGLDE